VALPYAVSLVSGTKLKFRFQVIGRAAGTLPSGILTVSYQRFTKPASLGVAVDLPTTFTTLGTYPDAAVTLANNEQYFDFETDTFDVAQGDTVLFKVARAAADGYSGDVFVIRQRGVLVTP
jgi:hypothetical protein